MRTTSQLGKTLADLCRDKKWSLSRLAKESRVPKTTLHAWTLGASPNIEQLQMVASKLEVPLYQLYFGRPDPHATVGQEVVSELFRGDVRIVIQKLDRK